MMVETCRQSPKEGSLERSSAQPSRGRNTACWALPTAPGVQTFLHMKCFLGLRVLLFQCLHQDNLHVGMCAWTYRVEIPLVYQQSLWHSTLWKKWVKYWQCVTICPSLIDWKTLPQKKKKSTKNPSNQFRWLTKNKSECLPSNLGQIHNGNLDAKVFVFTFCNLSWWYVNTLQSKCPL